MNKFVLTGILLTSSFSIVVFGFLYTVNITPKTINADQNQEIDACSAQFYLDNMWKGPNSVRVQNACLEQINLKLDKIISLEEQENKH